MGNITVMWLALLIISDETRFCQSEIEDVILIWGVFHLCGNNRIKSSLTLLLLVSWCMSSLYTRRKGKFNAPHTCMDKRSSRYMPICVLSIFQICWGKDEEVAAIGTRFSDLLRIFCKISGTVRPVIISVSTEAVPVTVVHGPPWVGLWPFPQCQGYSTPPTWISLSPPKHVHKRRHRLQLATLHLLHRLFRLRQR